MPDICMCENDKCILRQNCYRFLATPSYRQSYFLLSDKDKEEWKDGCENFWNINGENKKC